MFSGCLSGHERLLYAATFLYYANMVQQIEFIQTLHPFGKSFFPKVKVIGQRSKSKIKKKGFLTR